MADQLSGLGDATLTVIAKAEEERAKADGMVAKAADNAISTTRDFRQVSWHSPRRCCGRAWGDLS